MRATDLTTAPCNLRSTLEITRGPFTCKRRTALIVGAGVFTIGFATAMLAVVLFNLCQLRAGL